MKAYFKASFIATSLLAAVGGIFMGGCTKVDDTLGLNLVPDDQKVEVTTKTFSGIRSYSAFSDSVPTSRLRGMAMGSMATDFGRTTVRSVHQFMPLVSYKKRGDHYFGGANISLDSAYIVLYINKISGKTITPQTFQMFPLKAIANGASETWIDFSKTYYPNYDMTGKYENDPVFEFTLEKEITGARYKKLWSKSETTSPLYNEGKAYLQNIIGLPQSVWEDEEKGEGKFHEAVPGVYFAPKDLTGEAIYEMLLVDSYYLQDLSYIAIYTHDVDAEEPKALETKFYFDDKATTYPELSNLSVMLVDRDYSTATNGIDQSPFLRYEEKEAGKAWVMPALYDENGDPKPTIPQQEVMYVQAMAGASGYISFDKIIKEKLSEILDYDNKKYSAIFIDQSKLILPLAYDTTDPEYASKVVNFPSRLGLYLDYKGELPAYIPDYPYMDEILNSYKSKFGGYLNYSKAQYEMDISTYVRQLIVNPDKTRSELWIAPAFSASNFSRLQEVMLQNDPQGREITLEITYTLIK